MKNITRYTYRKTSFQGWRLCIARQGVIFVKYFADRAYETPELACDAAVAMRDAILAELRNADALTPESISAVFDRFR